MKCCGKFMELKTAISQYDGYGTLYFQCKKCGKIKSKGEWK